MGDRRALLNDSEEAFRIGFAGGQASIWTCIPATVEAVDFAKMTVSAQPTIQGVVSNENGVDTFVNLPLLQDVILCFPRAGGFAITFPVAVGDEVLILFASRCIDAWWNSSGVQKPMEARMHDLSDGFAILAPSSLPKALANVSATAVQIRNDAGTSYIEIKPDGKVKIKTSELTVDGNLKVTGTVTGNSATVPVGLTTHVHPGVTSGPSNTGGGVG